MKKCTRLYEMLCNGNRKIDNFLDKHGEKILDICKKIFPPVLIMWIMTVLVEIVLIFT